MTALPTNRDTTVSPFIHADDHNELHRLHNILDAIQPDLSGLAAIDAKLDLLAAIQPAISTLIDESRLIDGLILDTAGAPGSVDGYRGMLVIQPPTNDEEVIGIVIKIPDSTWGVSQDYAEGNFFTALSDADNFGAAGAAPTPILKVIDQTTNAAPVVVRTTATHGYSSGDLVRITGTGIAALDNRWWKILVVDTTHFSLNTSTAPGSTAAIGAAFTDRSPVLTRIADTGLGTLSIHVAPGLRGRASGAGSGLPTQALWINPACDSIGIIIQNAPATEWAPTPLADFFYIEDMRSSPTRKLFRVEWDGTLTMRPNSGRGATDILFRIRNDADTNNYLTFGTTYLTVNEGLATKVSIGDVFGFPGMGFSAGGSLDALVYRAGVGIIGISSALELPEMTAPAAGGVNTGRIYMQDNGAGKTQLMVKFNTGAAIQLAIQA